ncbi:NADH:flavin oxidoreductase [Pseudomonas amygdali pv. tabaci str. ATCC 11528]|uniref:oxidoreductase n=1 Tax=Pseudomonas amygdali TaxID=47877 RepID=UPI0009B82319|nr:NADH:flavin oxidoreductase [Pseudomonas amygdali]QED84837.1 NADH:flavin oxidoreductase [Pseudomonas amygdali pv. tabaci str. ATCC 11528]
MKADGAKAIFQIFHEGHTVRPGCLKESEVGSASDLPAEREGAISPRPLRYEEVGVIIESFVATTKRAIKAGFDGVDVHGANTYLIQQFYSAHSNRSNDRWGGTRSKRMRFPQAVTRQYSQP